MAGRLKVYLENSLVSMYYQEDNPYLRGVTRQFWANVLPGFEPFVSQVVLAEIRAAGRADLREALEKLVAAFEVLQVPTEAIRLSDAYLSARRLPRVDAVHLAAATVGGMDYLVTWNLRHLYRRGTQEMMREVNLRFGFPTPSVATPFDFSAEEKRDA